jgi:hypothetical protein
MSTFPTAAALSGAVIGGLLSVLAAWLGQRVQAKSDWLVQERKRRQRIYNRFVDAASRSFADALQQSESRAANLVRLYAEIGRMRLVSTKPVLIEANVIAHRILQTYGGKNHSKTEIRELLSVDSFDLFSSFGAACRSELLELDPRRKARAVRLTDLWPNWRMKNFRQVIGLRLGRTPSPPGAAGASSSR